MEAILVREMAKLLKVTTRAPQGDGNLIGTKGNYDKFTVTTRAPQGDGRYNLIRLFSRLCRYNPRPARGWKNKVFDFCYKHTQLQPAPRKGMEELPSH